MEATGARAAIERMIADRRRQALRVLDLAPLPPRPLLPCGGSPRQPPRGPHGIGHPVPQKPLPGDRQSDTDADYDKVWERSNGIANRFDRPAGPHWNGTPCRRV